MLGSSNEAVEIDSNVHIAQALGEASKAMALTSPNPRVGCLLVSADGKLLGSGHTQAAGGPHAEIVALRNAENNGHSVRGATAYVTLEPCSHIGRTGPCCDALIASGVHRVVASIPDPNPRVAGQGFEKLRAAGILVEIGAGAQESRELNIGFFSRMIRRTPWVRMKIAASLDGKTGLDNGVSQWITSAEARADGHIWRSRACAILTGIGTVLKDDPRLDVRLPNNPRQPHLIVIDSQLETPVDAHIFLAGRALYIYTAEQNDLKKAALEARGATVIYLPNGQGKVDLCAMLHDLARLEINELHVEAGQRLNGSLVREGLVDEFLVYLAPKLMGQGQGMANFGPLTTLTDAVPLVFTSTEMVGPDLRIVARVIGRDQFPSI
jgi:diaminohydroxyphosphoribosylaminopyrimidine deaminase/5-amino-6-(5-phosphoribosylamino)uracil reductase